MKKATIQISYDAEKLAAIQQYMGKKDLNIQAELEDALQKSYEKIVPPAVREYLETREATKEGKSPRPPRPRPAERNTQSDDSERS